MAVGEYDYVIIGAGSAGCVLASRLTEDPAVSVLLLEAGPTDGSRIGNWKIHMPAAFDLVWRNERFSWNYVGEPEPTLGDRRILQPRGRILGGSSGINGMCFLRGHPLDFARWVGQGAAGWSFPEVLPYYKKLESWQGGESAYRGGSGPVRVRAGLQQHPFFTAFLEAGRQAGYPATDDINGAVPEGFGAFQMNIDDGVRASASHAYLRPARQRPNLAIRTGAHAHRLLFEGRRAIGVRYVQDGRRQDVRARREVIVSGGAINSPMLLMLSGIGPADELRSLGIDVVADLPGVGGNLHDHPVIYMKFRCREPISYSRYMRLDRKLAAGARWLLTRTGPAASNTLETCAVLRSDAGVAQPDIEIQYLPFITDHDFGVSADVHGFTFCIGANRVEGTGSVRLRSADPGDPPRLLSNFLSTEHDLQLMRRSIEIGRDLAARPAYGRFGTTEEDPGPQVRTLGEIDTYLRGAVSGDFHLSCTCRMGGDPMAVVGPDLRVHGIEALRVVDASVMPSIVSANTNATTMMLAEKASDMIGGRPGPAPARLPVPA